MEEAREMFCIFIEDIDGYPNMEESIDDTADPQEKRPLNPEKEYYNYPDLDENVKV
jgi:hypothetical protein